MKHMKHIWIGLIMILLIAGCSSGKQSADDNGAQMTGKDTHTVNTANAADTGNNQEASQADNEVPVENKESDDSSLFGKFKSAMSKVPEYRVTYKYVASGETSESSQYFKGSDMRTDIVSDGVESRTLVSDSDMISCTNEDGWKCFKITMETDNQNEEADTGLENVKENIDDYKNTIVDAGTRKMLGETVNCFKIAEVGFEYTYCLTSDGIPLLIEGKQDGEEWSRTATAFSRKVPSDAFEPPVEPVDMAAMMDNLQGKIPGMN